VDATSAKPTTFGKLSNFNGWAFSIFSYFLFFLNLVAKKRNREREKASRVSETRGPKWKWKTGLRIEPPGGRFRDPENRP
jgi:hypothetical protein